MKASNKRSLIVLGVIVGLLVLIIAAGPFYIVREGEQAVVLRFGEIISVQQQPGLKFKLPFFDIVATFSSKVQIWDGEPWNIPTSEQQFIYVDTTARWRITDPKQFYETLTTMSRAQSRLDGIIDSVVRNVIASNSINDALRDSNRINEFDSGAQISLEEAPLELELSDELVQNPTLVETQVEQPRISKGRSQLMNDMASVSRQAITGFGIELIDVVIRQIRYSDELMNSVYQRMISDRNRIAQFYRSYGEGQKSRLLGELENQKVTILSDARRRAEEIMGTADAEAARIYADSYGENTEFFTFWRSIESYKQTLTSMPKTMSTDLDYFRYLYNQAGSR